MNSARVADSWEDFADSEEWQTQLSALRTDHQHHQAEEEESCPPVHSNCAMAPARETQQLPPPPQQLPPPPQQLQPPQRPMVVHVQCAESDRARYGPPQPRITILQRPHAGSRGGGSKSRDYYSGQVDVGVKVTSATAISSSSSSSSSNSNTSSSSAGPTARRVPVKSLQQRQAEYAEARQRILGSSGLQDTATEDTTFNPKSIDISPQQQQQQQQQKQRLLSSVQLLHCRSQAAATAAAAAVGAIAVRSPRGPDGSAGFNHTSKQQSHPPPHAST